MAREFSDHHYVLKNRSQVHLHIHIEGLCCVFLLQGVSVRRASTLMPSKNELENLALRLRT